MGNKLYYGLILTIFTGNGKLSKMKKTKSELLHDIENLQSECSKLKDMIFQHEMHAAKACVEVRAANDALTIVKEDAEKYKIWALEFKNKVSELEDDALVDFEEIDFGTGKLYYRINKGSTIVLNELMQALKDAALVVPLTSLVKSIKNNHVRF